MDAETELLGQTFKERGDQLAISCRDMEGEVQASGSALLARAAC